MALYCLKIIVRICFEIATSQLNRLVQNDPPFIDSYPNMRMASYGRIQHIRPVPGYMNDDDMKYFDIIYIQRMLTNNAW